MNGDNLNRYILIKINNFYSYNIYFKLLLSEVSTLFCLWAHKLSLDQPSWRGREPCSLLISLEGFYSFATLCCTHLSINSFSILKNFVWFSGCTGFHNYHCLKHKITYFLAWSHLLCSTCYVTIPTHFFLTLQNKTWKGIQRHDGIKVFF